MRFASVVLLLAAAGCYVGPAASGEGSGGGTASTCDGKDSCYDCLACANAQACAQLVSSCYQNSACAGIAQCVDICGGDATCEQQCLLNNPNGAAAYNAAQDCRYCEQCPTDCAGYRDCD